MVFPTPSIGNTLAILYLTSPWPGLLSLRSSFHFVLGFLHLPIHTVLSMQLRRVCRLHYWMLKNRWYVVPPWFCFDLSHVSMRDIWFIINFGMRLTDYNAANIYKSGWYFLMASFTLTDADYGSWWISQFSWWICLRASQFPLPSASHSTSSFSQFSLRFMNLIASHSSWCISHSC